MADALSDWARHLIRIDKVVSSVLSSRSLGLGVRNLLRSTMKFLYEQLKCPISKSSTENLWISFHTENGLNITNGSTSAEYEQE